MSAWNETKFVAMFAGVFLPASLVLAANDCVDELAGMLEALAERHHAPTVRGKAQRARDLIPPVCNEGSTLVAAAGRLVAELGDPAVRVLDAEHFQRTLEEWMGNPVVGVGLTEVLSVDIDEQTGQLTVVAPVPASPAASAGLRAGDVVATIDGAPAGALGLTRSMRRLRVGAGERVELGILRQDRLRKLSLEAVELPRLEAFAVEQAQLAGHDVLHVRLRQFVPGTADSLRAAIEAAANVSAIVLDLRDNPGGLVEELRQAAGLFLPPGTSIARITGPDPAFLAVAGDAKPVDTPVYVILGAGSASAAEALAGALQAHGRARIYGEQSFGKGLVHQALPLAGGATVMFPSGQLETPAGRPILGHGVEPDVRTSNPLTIIESVLVESDLVESTLGR